VPCIVARYLLLKGQNPMNPALDQLSILVPLPTLLYYGFRGDIFDHPFDCLPVFACGKELATAIRESVDLVLGIEARRKVFFTSNGLALTNTQLYMRNYSKPKEEHNEHRIYYIKTHQSMMEALKRGPLGKNIDVESLRLMVDNCITSRNTVFAAFAGVTGEVLDKLKHAHTFMNIKQLPEIPADT
jgi:hypothetical protein